MPRHAGKRGHAHGQHSQARLRERRHRLAHEAARLMAEGGLHDYHQAKLKAAQRLGILDDASMPRDGEIEEALREYQRLFQPDTAGQVQLRLEAALQALAFFQPFQPRLVGPLLEGIADARSPVALHLHSEDAEAVARYLLQHSIPATSGGRRLRLDQDRSGMFPTWLFTADGLGFELTVLPLAQLRQPPLAPGDDKPMRRASANQLRRLIADAASAVPEA